jgi:hypothetical protein
MGYFAEVKAGSRASKINKAAEVARFGDPSGGCGRQKQGEEPVT